MTAMSALIGGGVFELFAKLRAGIFETSAGWVPWLIERLDECYESKPNLVPNLKRKPSDVLADSRLFHSIDPGERYLAHCVQELGRISGCSPPIIRIPALPFLMARKPRLIGPGLRRARREKSWPRMRSACFGGCSAGR
jgi:hypothetical protein